MARTDPRPNRYGRRIVIFVLIYLGAAIASSMLRTAIPTERLVALFQRGWLQAAGPFFPAVLPHFRKATGVLWSLVLSVPVLAVALPAVGIWRSNVALAVSLAAVAVLVWLVIGLFPYIASA